MSLSKFLDFEQSTKCLRNSTGQSASQGMGRKCFRLEIFQVLVCCICFAGFKVSFQWHFSYLAIFLLVKLLNRVFIIGFLLFFLSQTTTLLIIFLYVSLLFFPLLLNIFVMKLYLILYIQLSSYTILLICHNSGYLIICPTKQNKAITYISRKCFEMLKDIVT